VSGVGGVLGGVVGGLVGGGGPGVAAVVAPAAAEEVEMEEAAVEVMGVVAAAEGWEVEGTVPWDLEAEEAEAEATEAVG